MGYNKKLRIIALFILLIVALFAGCNNTTLEQPPENKPNYQLNKTSITLFLDETFDLVVENNEYNKQILWKSTNPNCVTVSTTGKVTAKAICKTTTVSATVDGVILTCAVKVIIKQEGVAFIDLDNEVKTDGEYVLNLPVGDEYLLTPVLIDGKIVDGVAFTLSCENEKIVITGYTIKAIETVSNVIVKITCIYENVEHQLNVKVNAVNVGG